ncbi:MAG TPA: matrixin family metalloprotease [Patescibacteria group bacterium]
MIRFLRQLFTLTLVLGIVYTSLIVWPKIQKRLLPCGRPITYDIGQFDSQFNISQTEFLNSIQQAETIWEKSVSRDLFAYTPGSAFKINLIYDERQMTTEKQKTLDNAIDNDIATLDEIKARYLSLEKTYTRELAQYNQDVSYWNSQGGAPKAEYDRLERQRASLNTQVQRLNSLSSRITTLASTANQKIDEYNTNAGQVFDKGVYQRAEGKEEINIYEFKTPPELVLALTHELGHAIGLNHLSQETSIMYPVLSAQPLETITPTTEDITALKSLCRIP